MQALALLQGLIGLRGLEVPAAVGDFDMLPRGKVNIAVTRAAEGVDDAVGFKVYRVNPRGTLRYLGQVSGTQRVTARVESRTGGTFVVETVAGLKRSGCVSASHSCLSTIAAPVRAQSTNDRIVNNPCALDIDGESFQPRPNRRAGQESKGRAPSQGRVGRKAGGHSVPQCSRGSTEIDCDDIR